MSEEPMTVQRRTFEAATHPKGSEERARLNCDALTSEYYPSKRYLTSDGRAHVTKREAEAHARERVGC
jgi:hypothetical protein